MSRFQKFGVINHRLLTFNPRQFNARKETRKRNIARTGNQRDSKSKVISLIYA